MNQYIIPAILSGIFACLNSLLTKLAIDRKLISIFNEFNISLNDDKVVYYVRALMLILTVMSNLAMWGCFTKALSLSQSSIQVTTLNNCTNLLFSGILGYLLLNETINAKWVFGVMLVVIGSYLLNKNNEDEKEKSKIE
ncbi:hypothetical protein CONCODRAFT_77867 [Conidiobolus coronatus NRRL 28638]|uniref:EamA domain-containing protein n=1 Tax=Conidiobolus coronatus (strain ATCC 28846 / CBS 209.66 / NRRL 28638) TaxID=796925 RepID=A0A137PBG1_CONC2|nr:hypothetical protein CONCODRAFT_77867 [Conidiobolus coronatus NRRL 28638]|eukprot:KXN72272.1 hypothetical protein CONCODRAFT_77867 [Conidiobolus coronatus NRRL 28638]